MKEGEVLLKEGEVCWTCFQISFCYDMLCCHQCQRGRLLDTIDNWVLSLMLHKCHIRYQSITELSHSANAKVSFNRAHSVTKRKSVKSVFTERTRSPKENEKSVFTEFTRSPKESWWSQFLPSSLGPHRELSAYRVHSVIEGFHEILCINRAQSVNTGIIFWTEFTVLGRPVKEFVKIYDSADCCNHLFFKLFEPTC